MNISNPVAGAIERVDFKFISTEEIRAISVKQVQNDNTFDSLMLPVPDGLYDTALGAWGDLPCDTCHLRNAQCPGHPGHIELPVPVYHPVFMDQVLRLLRSQCIYCHNFKLGRKDVHAYICKFRLLQYGLVQEAASIDTIAEDILGLDDDTQGVTGEADEEGNLSTGLSIRKREQFVKDSLRRAKRLGSELAKHEGATHMRGLLIKQFLADVVKTRRCATCQGVSPTYRKDRYVKIFEKALSSKDRAAMERKNLKAVDAMATLRKHRLNEEYSMHEDPPSSAINDSSGSADPKNVAEEVQARSPDTAQGQRYLDAMEVRARLTLLFEREQEVLGLLYNGRASPKPPTKVSAEMFFLQAVLVPPNRFRPEARMGPDRISEAQQNSLYKNILRSSERVVQAHHELREENGSRSKGTRSKHSLTLLHQAWTDLQDSVNCLIDKTKSPVQGLAAQRVEDGIKQKLEKKEGLFRKNMMGKRVNYAARSVISPDPMIDTNEIGVPPVFATRLTYPEPVTSHNVRELAQAVINGAEQWPGASALENEAGQIMNLRWKTAEERESLAHQLLTPSTIEHGGIRNKKVHRHLANGDVVLMNRQPTLHKPSIMGHRVRVLPGEKTIRMHYANCNTYNADFDGDEMNMHFPQNEIARAEALQLADTDHQYLSGTQGSPLRGLIQDHLSISVALCSKDTFMNRGDYHQLVYSALRPESGHILCERIKLIPPAILKPAPLWTGKQVVTTILLNITPQNCGGLWMKGGSKIRGSAWGVAGAEEESVYFSNGVFITGILDKSQLGPSSGGFIHSVHEVYGPTVAGRLLSSLGRLLTRTLHMRAFTCGIDDLTLTPQGESSRLEKLEESQGIGLRVAAGYVGIDDEFPPPTDPVLLSRLEEVMRDDAKQENLDMLVNGSAGDLSSKVTQACLPVGLEKPFPRNHMQSMTVSGAKGSQVNANQISVNLGQQVLEGRRVPLMVNGKSLPCFKPFDTNLRAGGYIVNRFLTGIRPQEYFFHLMAGREGLIDTAVKTSRSGYLQRCIIKGMEGLVVAYDTTVRDSDGALIQFLYGEDGIDITKQEYLENFEFILRNIESQASQLQFGADKNKHLTCNKTQILKQMKSALKHTKRGSHLIIDPANSLFNPARNLFATSEKFFGAMTSYLSENKDDLIRGPEDSSALPSPASRGPKPSRKTAETLLVTKFMRSLVEPGEAVGIVAGQSIGEPSTQMTLNTFHLAGHSAKNVTLGIPRLREILMTAAKNISTPSMTLLVNKNLTVGESDLFAKSISVLPLSHIVDAARVVETVGKSDSFGLAKLYKICLTFFPIKEIQHMYGIDTLKVLSTVENALIPHLLAIARKEIKKRSSQGNSAIPVVGVRAGFLRLSQAANLPQVASEENDDDGDDGDATSARENQNRAQTVSYGPNDVEDDLIQTQMAREASPFDDYDYNDEDTLCDTTVNAREEDIGRPQFGESSQQSSPSVDDQGAGVLSRIRSKHTNVSYFGYRLSNGPQSTLNVEFTLEYDIETPKLLMVNLVRDAVKRSVVHQVQGLEECTFVAKEKINGNETPVIHTSGVNVRAMWQYPDFLDVNRIITNDIATTLEEYGVEACRSNIIGELRGVFQSHNITVDNRHLNLIADHMTRNGGFTPFNRLGLAGNVSPFTKMSFETTVAFLRDALIEGDWDDLTTPSARIVVGQLGRVGTGSFDVLGVAPTSFQMIATN